MKLSTQILAQIDLLYSFANYQNSLRLSQKVKIQLILNLKMLN